MDDVIRLINHLLDAKYSIDKIESITNRLNIPKDQLLRLVRADRYKDYFQLLRPGNKRNQEAARIALTLDLFCCTHYAQQCKNQSCSFLHLCPYNIRPMHGKCTNKICPYDHEVLKSAHNQRLINTRGLSFISNNILLELARASADPNRSFWVCTDNGKKGGCSKKSQCDKLHYCYYSLTNACTKPHCPHIINDACNAYFRHKDLAEQDHDDILEAFKKVLRQRKPDYVNTVNVPPHPSWELPVASNTDSLINGDDQSKSTVDLQHQTSTSFTRSTLSATAPEYYGRIPSQSEHSTPLPEENEDIILFDSPDEYNNIEVERYLTEEIGYPIKLVISKTISSEIKNSPNLNDSIQPIYYYCPTEKLSDIFQLLRWQNEQNYLIKPLIVYSTVRDAHEATELNIENNQFCLLRVHLLHSDVVINEKTLELNNPTLMSFDRMWIYIYDDS